MGKVATDSFEVDAAVGLVLCAAVPDSDALKPTCPCID